MRPVVRSGVSVVGTLVTLVGRMVAGLGGLALLMAAALADAGVPPVSVDGKVPTLAPLLKTVTPAVVNIYTKTTLGPKPGSRRRLPPGLPGFQGRPQGDPHGFSGDESLFQTAAVFQFAHD